MQTHSRYDNNGAYVRIIEYDDEDDADAFDRIVVRVPKDNPNRLACTAYEGEEAVWQTSFENRSLSFDPISLMGRGESEKLQGTSPVSKPYESVPRDVMVAMNGLGLTVVPQGEWWL